MKYMLLFCSDPPERERFSAMSDDEMIALEQRVYSWIQENAAAVVAHGRLDLPARAKSLRPDGKDGLSISDGPFIEGSEIVGGFALVEAASLDGAAHIAKSWPVGPVEVREVV